MEAFEGVILKQINFKESSKILYLYTPNGPMSVLVHGAKKITGAKLALTENLTRIRFFGSGKAMKTMTDGEILSEYRKIKDNLEKFTYAQHLTEILHFFSESEIDHKKMYEFLRKILDKIENEVTYVRYVNMFELKLLYLLGVAPNFVACAACGATRDLRFSVQDGGYVCPEHATATVFEDPGMVERMKILYYHDLKNPLEFKPDDQIRRQIRLFLDDYYLYHLNFKSKSRTILNGLIGY